jgi:hypothetical protein
VKNPEVIMKNFLMLCQRIHKYSSVLQLCLYSQIYLNPRKIKWKIANVVTTKMGSSARLLLLLLLLFTAIGFAPGGSSPALVQTKTIKEHYAVVQHNTILTRAGTTKCQNI